MVNNPQNDTPAANQGGIKGILEWLALAHGKTTPEDSEALLSNAIALRQAPISTAQRTKLLDLLYAHCEGIVRQELQQFNEASLPISRKTRQRIKNLLELLETLTQDYFNTLAILFDPDASLANYTPQVALRRAIQAVTWQIRIHHLIAAPPRQGLWQQLHAAFRTARQIAVEQQPGPRDTPSIQRLYTNTLLIGIAHPASFSATEQEFINTLIEQLDYDISPSESLAQSANSIFWIDPDRDFPAHALVRRTPAGDAKTLYFSCAEIAQHIATLRQAVTTGRSPGELGLPEFAGTPSGQGVLRRLEKLWGQPAKRKFPRRRQSHRIHLCAGLNTLHHLLSAGEHAGEFSEWMVTNESPDGFALMHMTGDTSPLKVGDIVAMQVRDDSLQRQNNWLLCMLRWAISENPEHVEIGLQLLATKAIPARIARSDQPTAGLVNALILPASPPLRPSHSLVAPPGFLNENQAGGVALVEQGNLAILEIQTGELDEQTAALEIFHIQAENTDLDEAHPLRASLTIRDTLAADTEHA